MSGIVSFGDFTMRLVRFALQAGTAATTNVASRSAHSRCNVVSGSCASRARSLRFSEDATWPPTRVNSELDRSEDRRYPLDFIESHMRLKRMIEAVWVGRLIEGVEGEIFAATRGETGESSLG